MPALANEAALAERHGRLVLERGVEHRVEGVEVGELLAGGGEERRLERGGGRADLAEGGEAGAQADEVARVGDAERRAARQTLEVADALQEGPQPRARRRALDEGADRVVARADRVDVEQRSQEPLAEEARPHGGVRLVEDAEEGAPRRAAARLEQLERLDARRVEQHGVGGREARQPRQVAEGLALGQTQVAECHGRRLEARAEVADAEPVERLDAEVRAEVRGGAARARHLGVVEGQRGARLAKPGEEGRLLARRPGEEDLGGPTQERRRQRRVVAPGVLPRPELPRRHVHECEAGGVAVGREREEKVVCGPREVRRVGDRAGRDDPDDVAPEQLLGGPRRLELLAHRDLLARADEARDVAVGGVMRDAGHGCVLPRGERDLQEPRRELGVLEKRLVEVAEAEQQQVVGVPALELPVLPHHGRRRLRVLSQRGGPGAGRTSPRAPRA